jgi:hypothetical protein
LNSFNTNFFFFNFTKNSLDEIINPPKQENKESLTTNQVKKNLTTEQPKIDSPTTVKKFDLKQEWQLLKTSFKEDLTIFNERFQPNSSISPNLYDDVFTPSGSSFLFRMENQISQIKTSFNDSCKSADVKYFLNLLFLIPQIFFF